MNYGFVMILAGFLSEDERFIYNGKKLENFLMQNYVHFTIVGTEVYVA